MTSMTVFSALLLALVICTQGYARVLTNTDYPQDDCSVQNIRVQATATGKTIEGKPQWSVEISNQCSCPQKDVYLNCAGFHSVEMVDPSVCKIMGDACLINGGSPIVSAVPKYFTYAWEPQFNFVPLNSTKAC